MATLWYGVQVMIVGLVVVFFGLVLLIGCIKLMSGLVAKRKKDDMVMSGTIPAPAPVQEDDYEFEYVAEDTDDTALVAVITAAIAAMLDGTAQAGDEQEGSAGFIVRRIRRVQQAPAWNRAGREEQIYSRL